MLAKSFQSGLTAGPAGVWKAPLRWGLSALEGCYRWAIQRRNDQFASGARRVVRLDVPVISVGNITTGGTGKTPVVIDLVRRLAGRGRTPAVVSRGYKSKPGRPGDELTLLSDKAPQTICVADPDRVAGGRSAIAQGADVIVLDDAFQHRRIARDLDIVLVDATLPFGFDRLLPLGRLREPTASLSRAGLIVVTRADLVSEADLTCLTERIDSEAPRTPCVTCCHQPSGFLDLSGAVCHGTHRRAFLISGIGNPEAFVRTVERQGIEVVGSMWWPDHHHYTARDVARAARAARAAQSAPRAPHDVVLTTAKDAVKLRELDTTALEPVRVVDIEIAYLGRGEERVEACLDSVLA